MKTISHIVLRFALFVCFDSLHAQVAPPIEWQKSLGGSNQDYAYSIDQTFDGGFIAAGWSNSNNGDVTGNHGLLDYWITRLDPSGNLIWQKSLGGSNDDQASFIEQTTDGGFIVTGSTASNNGDVATNHGGDDYWVLKLDSTGDIVWQKSLGGSGNDEAFSVRQTTDGGFIVAGVSASSDGDITGNHGGRDYWIVKLDSTGNLVWQKSFGGSSYDEATSIDLTTDGGYIVTGWAKSTDGDVTGNHGNYDYWSVKMDGSGNMIWEKSYGGSTYDQPWFISQTGDGGYVISGYSSSSNGNVSGSHGGYDNWIIKLNATGNLVWQNPLGGGSDDRGYSVHGTSDGGIITVANTFSNNGNVSGNHGSNDYWLVKLDMNGTIEWQKCLGGTSADIPNSMQQTADGGYIVAGYASSTNGDVTGNHGGYDFWIVKLSADIATGISPDASGNIISIYPNPVQSELTIDLHSPVAGIYGPGFKYEIHVFDLQGKMIILPVTFSSILSVQNMQATLNTDPLPEGFYILEITDLQSGNKEVRKFIRQ